MIASASVARFDGLFRSSERSIHIAGIRNHSGPEKQQVISSTIGLGPREPNIGIRTNWRGGSFFIGTRQNEWVTKRVGQMHALRQKSTKVVAISSRTVLSLCQE